MFNPCPYECRNPRKCTVIVDDTTTIIPAQGTRFSDINAAKQFKLNIGITFTELLNIGRYNAVHSWFQKYNFNILRSDKCLNLLFYKTRNRFTQELTTKNLAMDFSQSGILVDLKINWN